MIRIIPCVNCDKETIPLDSTTIEIALTKGRWCKVCNRPEPIKQTFFFCCEKCFDEFDKSKIQWKN